MKRFTPFLFSLSGGLLSSIAWWDRGSPLVMLFAFVPFIYLFARGYDKRVQHSTIIFFYMLPGFLLFNILTFSWLRNVSPSGAIAVVLGNSFLMSAIFWLSTLVRDRAGGTTGYVTLIAFWMTFEHLALHVPIFSPWLNLGNCFGFTPRLIQWYEYTGIAGGSLWVIMSNILIFRLAVMPGKPVAARIIPATFTLAVLIVPVMISILIYRGYSEKGELSEILIVQSNVDPYNEKFSRSFDAQLDEMIKMSDEANYSEFEWILYPETIVDEPFPESEASQNRYVIMLDSFLLGKRMTNLMAGITTRSDGLSGDHALNHTDTGYVETFNSAMQLADNEEPSFYHKSKLIPAVEKKISIIPPFLARKFTSGVGGTKSGYGSQDSRDVFVHTATGTRVAPVICYESVFGEYVTGWVKNGAELIFVITNDGWWYGTQGYKQHLIFSSIRAIETRRSVARAANTGISCLINQKGDIIAETQWWSKATLAGSLGKNREETIYSKYGDWIYRGADLTAVILILITFIAIPIRKLRGGTKN